MSEVRQAVSESVGRALNDLIDAPDLQVDCKCWTAAHEQHGACKGQSSTSCTSDAPHTVPVTYAYQCMGFAHRKGRQNRAHDLDPLGLSTRLLKPK